MSGSVESPLHYHTPSRWARQALKEPLELLSDHAYLERKAASNVLEMFNRWPEPGGPEGWSLILAGVARDEARHMEMVLRLLERRGGRLQRLHKNSYANDLRTLVRAGKGKQEILDRLLVSALIEVRSCERFELLGAASRDRELSAFYKSLAGSEAGHYQVFMKLAGKVLSPHEVETRWQDMLAAEAQIIQAQEPGPRIHSGL